jgi:hypothetical protein
VSETKLLEEIEQLLCGNTLKMEASGYSEMLVTASRIIDLLPDFTVSLPKIPQYESI